MYTNVWYVAARNSDLLDEPLYVQMLGSDFVLFRDNKGTPVCLNNVCPHRGASLANGSLSKEGLIACPFHGWEFNGLGQCIRMPSIGNEDPKKATPGVKIDSYPTKEKHGLIWTFLGDDLENANPIFDIPEMNDPSYTVLEHDVVFESNFHTAKFSNLDYVHLPVVHGIKFEDQDNPYRPPPHVVEKTDYGLTAHIETDSTPSEGKWEGIREKGTRVKSILKYFTAGATLRGEVEIGAINSGQFNAFYEFSTPITQTSTMMRYYFFRNFMTDKKMDDFALERNLKNIYEDKAIAETQEPKYGPNDMPNIVGRHEDTILKVYWELMHEMRDKGWQIDNKKWNQMTTEGKYCVMPSIDRKNSNEKWGYPMIPRLKNT
ncbi:MAG: aromatic ring-hydroxylating dioxygenase subunit alpha [Gammaproteobacteria bacterium]|nr:aromatic ring-hydroxylating dioxygenase subunit alpha [Gammaproteobacteria bacterium]